MKKKEGNMKIKLIILTTILLLSSVAFAEFKFDLAFGVMNRANASLQAYPLSSGGPVLRLIAPGYNLDLGLSFASVAGDMGYNIELGGDYKSPVAENINLKYGGTLTFSSAGTGTGTTIISGDISVEYIYANRLILEYSISPLALNFNNTNTVMQLLSGRVGMFLMI